jgi:arylsulfatase A-like enzyme
MISRRTALASGVRRILALVLALAAVACARGGREMAARPASVLLVTVDTLRADRLGCYGDAQARTPAADGLARAGVRFERAYTPAPLTLPAHASLMTGLLPPAHGVRANGGYALPAGPPTLAEALRARGLATAAFVAAFPVARRFGLHRGFDHYDDTLSRPGGVHYEFAERPATAVVQAASDWLAAHAGPAFVWVHLFEPHAPYDPPAAFRGPDPYRGEVAAADSALARLLAAWDARPDPSLVVLTADHGEAFGEHGEESHSLFVYDTTLHVPLVLRGAGVPAGARVAAAVSLSDVAATVLDAVGAPASMPGATLLPAARGGAAPAAPLYAETLAPQLDFGWSPLFAWRDGSSKYIHAPRPELYDLAADPAETRNLAATRGAEAARLAAALAAHRQRGSVESRGPADVEAAERLRALGYVQGPGARGTGADPKDKVEVARRIAGAAGPFASHAAAAEAYAALFALDPDVPVVNLRLADALLRSGRAAQAVPRYEQVIAAAPRTADAHVGLATAYAELGRLEDAARVLRAALAVDPDNGQVHYNLGEIARAKGDLVAARARYERALGDPITEERARQRLTSLH